MAVTNLAVVSNRFRSDSTLRADSLTVPLDATVNEGFRIPAGYGSILIKSVVALVSSLSGAYVAPAPAYDGMWIYIVAPDGNTLSDNIGVMRFVHTGTSAARPTLTVGIDLQNWVLARMMEQVIVTIPILAGAGVTGTVTCVVRGERFQTA